MKRKKEEKERRGRGSTRKTKEREEGRIGDRGGEQNIGVMSM